MPASRSKALIRSVLARSPHFSSLPPATLDRVAAASTVEKLAPGQIVRDGPDGAFWIVLSGALQLLMSPVDGRAATIAIFGVGSFFGVGTIIGNKALGRECRALVPTVAAKLRASVLKQLMKDDPAFREQLERLVILRLDAITSLFADSLNAPLRQRLARRLAAQALAGGGTKPEAGVELTVSQTMLAQMLGVSRTSVVEELGALEREGILRRGYRKITVTDPARLHDISGPNVIAL